MPGKHLQILVSIKLTKTKETVLTKPYIVPIQIAEIASKSRTPMLKLVTTLLNLSKLSIPIPN